MRNMLIAIACLLTICTPAAAEWRCIEGDCLNGFATLTDDSDGTTYTGTFKDGRFHGSGRYIASDGSYYEGGFRDGKRQGKGRMVVHDGPISEGEFVNGHLVQGTMMYRSGALFTGKFDRGVPRPDTDLKFSTQMQWK